MKTITPEIKLAAHEIRLLEHYRAMEDCAASDLAGLAQEYARLFPRDRPKLHLVQGGVK